MFRILPPSARAKHVSCWMDGRSGALRAQAQAATHQASSRCSSMRSFRCCSMSSLIWCDMGEPERARSVGLSPEAAVRQGRRPRDGIPGVDRENVFQPSRPCFRTPCQEGISLVAPPLPTAQCGAQTAQRTAESRERARPPEPTPQGATATWEP